MQDRLKKLLAFNERSLTLISRVVEDRESWVLERLRFNSEGTEFDGFLTRPMNRTGPLPAVLFAHAHGGCYEIGARELAEGRPAWRDAPGPALAAAGLIALAIDMPCFGSRASVGESAASKAALWRGQPLFGQMLGEQAGALTWLTAQPEVDPHRIGMLGLSMGATLGYFLAALDPRIAALAQICCFADFATLVETGAHDLHGNYLTVPGLLHETSTGQIAGLTAPRPQLICIGEDDPLTPPLAVRRAQAEVAAAYRAMEATHALEVFVEAGIGHSESPEMRRRILDFFRQSLCVL